MQTNNPLHFKEWIKTTEKWASYGAHFSVMSNFAEDQINEGGKAMDKEKKERRTLYQLSAVGVVIMLAIFAILLPKANENAKIKGEADTREVVLHGEDKGALSLTDALHPITADSLESAVCDSVSLSRYAGEYFAVKDASVRANAEVVLALSAMLRDYGAANASYTLPIVTEGVESASEISPLAGGYGVMLSLLVPKGDEMTPVTLENPLAAAFYAWLASNASHYGFSIDPSGLLRYLGIPHAAYLFQNAMTLSEYLTLISEKTAENPLVIDYAGDTYQVFFVSDKKGEGKEIRLPRSAAYSVSGSNLGGYVITVCQK